MDTRFINSIPDSVYVILCGHLLYDVDTELYAGFSGEWVKRTGEVLNHNHLTVPACGEEWNPIIENNSQNVLRAVREGEEVLLVPCKSYEAQIKYELVIHQEFDWEWAIVIKSRSGSLYGGTCETG